MRRSLAESLVTQVIVYPGQCFLAGHREEEVPKHFWCGRFVAHVKANLSLQHYPFKEARPPFSESRTHSPAKSHSPAATPLSHLGKYHNVTMIRPGRSYAWT